MKNLQQNYNCIYYSSNGFKTATVLGSFHSNPKKILPALLPVTTVGIQTQNLFHPFILQILLLLKATLNILKLLYMYLKAQLDR